MVQSLDSSWQGGIVSRRTTVNVNVDRFLSSHFCNLVFFNGSNRFQDFILAFLKEDDLSEPDHPERARRNPGEMQKGDKKPHSFIKGPNTTHANYVRETILNEKISECLQNDGTIAELLAKIWDLECKIRKERNRLYHSHFFALLFGVW